MDWRAVYLVIRRAIYAVLAEFDRQLRIPNGKDK